jgi:hypothetical protein
MKTTKNYQAKLSIIDSNVNNDTEEFKLFKKLMKQKLEPILKMLSTLIFANLNASNII